MYCAVYGGRGGSERRGHIDRDTGEREGGIDSTNAAGQQRSAARGGEGKQKRCKNRTTKGAAETQRHHRKLTKSTTAPHKAHQKHNCTTKKLTKSTTDPKQHNQKHNRTPKSTCWYLLLDVDKYFFTFIDLGTVLIHLD